MKSPLPLLFLVTSILMGCDSSNGDVDETAVSAIDAEELPVSLPAMDNDQAPVESDPVISEQSIEDSNNQEELIVVENSDESVTSENIENEGAINKVEASLELVSDKTIRITWQTTPTALFYRVLENLDGISGFTAVSAELDATTSSYDRRVALYASVNARYVVQSCNDQGCADSAPVMVEGTLDDSIGYIKASNTGSSHEFGSSISLSADGNTLVVGAPLEASTSTGINSDPVFFPIGATAGAVYVFARIDERWQQQAYVKASNTGHMDNFGRSVSLSADGNTLAVGAPREDSSASGINGDQADDTATNSGAAYTFIRDNGVWQQQAYIKASNANEGFDVEFGFSVSLSADGNTLAVGARSEDNAATGINSNQNNNSANNSGAAYVFIRTLELWEQQAYVKANNTGNGDFFGWSVALSEDGNTLAVGARSEGSAATGVNGDQNDNSQLGAGAVYVFNRNESIWQQQAYVKASNPERFDNFGVAISLSADGNTLVVGSTGESSSVTGINADQSDNSSMESGAAYVFVRVGELWQQQAYLKASNTDEMDNFGISVSLSADGNTLAVGADQESSAATGIDGDQDNQSFKSGAVYTFVRRDNLWQQQAYVKASNTEPEDLFGAALSLSADGDTLAAGAVLEDSDATGINGDQGDNSVDNSGAVYFY